MASSRHLGIALGGGGVPGLAWMVGLLHAWDAQGFRPDVVGQTIGTSAGAAAAALWHHSAGIGAAYRRQVDPGGAPSEARPPDLSGFLTAVERAAAHPVGSAGHLAAYLRGADSLPDDGLRRASVADRLAGARWPDAPLAITALAHGPALRRVLTVDDGFPLVDVVTASCAVPQVWPAVRLGDELLSDAGVLSDAHADLLADFHDVVVVEPVPNIGGRYRAAELAVLERALRIVPNDEAVAAIGSDPFDAGGRAAAARAGYAQGLREWHRIANLA